MIDIKSISIRNFMGIESVDIDIENVKGSVVFILGHNGAGKSSILEALYYAFTDTVERLPGMEKRGILRQGSDEGYVEVQFYGKDGKLYKIRKTFKRRKKGDYKYDARLRVLNNGGWINVSGSTDKKEDIKETVKRVLDIDSGGKIGEILKSTALIMQGKIDEMIEKQNPQNILTQAGVVPVKEEDIRNILNEKIRAAKEQLTEVKGYVDLIIKQVIDEYSNIEFLISATLNATSQNLIERWQEIKNVDVDRTVENANLLSSLLPDTISHLEHLKVEIERYKGGFEAQRKIEHLDSQLKSIEITLHQKKNELKDNQEQLNEIESEKNKLQNKLYRLGLSSVHRESLHAIKEMKKRGLDIDYIRLLSNMFPIDEEEYKTIYNEIKALKKKLSKEKIYNIYWVYAYLKERYEDTTEEEIKQYEELVNRQRKLQSQWDIIDKFISDKTSQLEPLLKEREDLEKEKISISKEIDTLRKQYPHIDKWLGYIQSIREALHLKNSIGRLKSQINDMSDQAMNIKQLKLKKEKYAKVEEQLVRLSERWKNLPEVHGSDNVSVVEQWVVEYGKYMLSRDHVCPICGKDHSKDNVGKHPVPEIGDTLIDALRGMQSEKISQEKERILQEVSKLIGKKLSPVDALSYVQKKKEKIEKDYENAQRQAQEIQTLQKEINRYENDLRIICQNVGISCDIITQQLIQSIENYKELLSQLEMKKRLLSTRGEEIKRIQDELEAKRKEKKKLEEELIKIPDDVQKRYKQITIYHRFKKYEQYLYKPEKNLSPGNYYDGIENDIETLISYKQLLSRLKDKLSEEYINWRKKKNVKVIPSIDEVKLLNQYIIDVKKKALVVVSLANFNEIYEKVDTLLKDIDRLEEVDRNIRDAESKVNSLSGIVQSLSEQKHTLLQKKEELIKQVNEIPAYLKQLIGERSYEIVIEQIQSSIKRLKDWKEEIDRRYEQLEQLNRRKELLDYISRKLIPPFYKWYFNEIMNTFRRVLSENLHTLSGRYEVRNISGEKGIEIYDEWLGEIRPVHMLSGGEKAMLGLSFIFALSEMFGGSTGRVFFVDEGFSALDKDRKSDLKGVLDNLIENSSHTIFIITHDERILDSAPPESPVIYMKKGKIDRWSTAGGEIARETPFAKEDDEISNINNQIDQIRSLLE